MHKGYAVIARWFRESTDDQRIVIVALVIILAVYATCVFVKGVS